VKDWIIKVTCFFSCSSSFPSIPHIVRSVSADTAHLSPEMNLTGRDMQQHIKTCHSVDTEPSSTIMVQPVILVDCKEKH